MTNIAQISATAGLLPQVSQSADSVTTRVDYSMPADLYYRNKSGGRRAVSFRRFDTAAAAIEFAVEQLDASSLKLATLEVNEERFAPAAIRQLYDSIDYPLPRSPIVDRRSG